jgi:hypothetical protein
MPTGVGVLTEKKNKYVFGSCEIPVCTEYFDNFHASG